MTQVDTSINTLEKKNNYKKYFLYFIIVFSIIILLSYSGVITINIPSNNMAISLYENKENIDNEPIEKYINIFMLKQDEAISTK